MTVYYGTLSYRDDDGLERPLEQAALSADGKDFAKLKLFNRSWDARLDATSCLPIFELRETTLAELAENVGDESLDELVHDVKSQEAAGINNEGQEAQLAFLLSQLDEEQIVRHLDDQMEWNW